MERLPGQIQKFEEEQEVLCARMADVAFYQKDPKEIAEVQNRAEAVVDKLLELYQRWELLESVN